MYDVFDYIEWRGDLTLKQAKLNDIDSMILCRLSYLPFPKNVSSKMLTEAVTITQAYKEFLIEVEDESVRKQVIMAGDIDLFDAIARSRRFGKMKLSGYINEIDLERQQQFSAVLIEISEDSLFVAYRGTDLTIVGWKEDLNMSYMKEIPAQKSAADYLDAAGKLATGQLIVGGHSKGGNLAVFAGATCSCQIREKITHIYNFDGPGFNTDFIQSEGYQVVKDRIHTIIPQTSFVGMMLEHEENYTVIQSKQVGLMQHDLFSWNVRRDHLITVETVDNTSKFVDRALKAWVFAMSLEQREQFSDALYEIFAKTEVSTLNDLVGNRKNAERMIKSYAKMDKETKLIIHKGIGLLFRALRKNITTVFPKAPVLTKGQIVTEKIEETNQAEEN